VIGFAANVGFLFRELPYLERFAAASAAGFEAVEFAWPVVPAERVAAAIQATGLRVVLINVAAGDLDAGERGYANDPAATVRWRADVQAALRLADAVDCPTLNVLVGNQMSGTSLLDQFGCLRANLDWALPIAGRAGRALVVEMLNPIDTPRYLLTDPARTAAFIRAVDDPGFGLQFDTYHMGLVAPDVVEAFRELAPLVRHVQIADVPGRHEPGTGTLDWTGFFGALDDAAYSGAVGLEYVPLAGTTEGLGWIDRDEPSGVRRKRE
jgi:hydroxypyruvate isomerase